MEEQKNELAYVNDNLQTLVKQKTKAITELQNAILFTVSSLVENRDDNTGKHALRTSEILRLLCGEMIKTGIYKEELQSWDTELFLQSSALHDVGKISIKDSILLKPDKLTNEEFNEIKKHAIYGEQIIDSIIERCSSDENAFLTHARIVAGSHHEKWDGSGYPRGLSGENIPLQGRMMAIADVFDALISDRIYKKAFSHIEAIGIINRSSGTQFDPKLINIFNKVESIFQKSFASL
jgi:putative two-component system response regulator